MGGTNIGLQLEGKQDLPEAAQETLATIDAVTRGEAVSGHAVHAWLDSWGGDDELSPPVVGQ